jgi:low temperature requirement protein LtrA
VVQGLLLLALLWWTWSAYAWLGNQARADEGVLRAGMAVAMAAIFVVALTVPEAWQDAPGGLNGPLVLVGAYLLVRCVHLILYGVAAAGDRGLRRQLAITWVPLLAGAALLIAGALVGGWAQTLLFAGALLVDWVGVYLTSRQGNWRLHSAGHWTERHGNFIILAIGESVVAIGAGAAAQPISAPLLLGAVLGVEGVLAHAVTASRWAASMPPPCSAGRRCTWPGSWCSSSAYTARRASPGWSRSACSWRRCRPRSPSRRWPGWPAWCSSWPP